jgi:hypothetical protein
MQSIKALTGNDMSDGGIRVNVTAVVSTMNKLYYPLDIKDKARAGTLLDVLWWCLY